MAVASHVLEPPMTSRTASRPRLRKIELVVNSLAGHVGAGAASEAEQIIRELGFAPRVRTPAPSQLMRQLREAVETGPDLVIVLAGDGTARAAAGLCGPEGPLLAPLPGGTMNMLPHALYGPGPWTDALRQTLTLGVERAVSGGQVDGLGFHVAAILGPPALWAEAREAARIRRPALALRKARLAWTRTFASHVAYTPDGGRPGRAEALCVICPLVSRALREDEPMLEVAALRPRSAADAVRLGLHALLSEIVGDWRKDPSVEVTRSRSGVVLSDRGHIRAILDGEPVKLARRVTFGFAPVAFRALAPPLHPSQSAVSSMLG
jgi:diacylglycerol kinase family enzyme